MNVICPLSISESWAELTHHTVQGLILRLSEIPKIAAVIPIIASENAREYYCFGYRGEKKKQADVNFRLVSAFIFSFTKVMLQLGDKLLACEVLVSYWRRTAETAAAVSPMILVISARF